MATKPANTGRITGALYRPLVEALFRDTQTMVLGVVASTLGVLLTAYHTKSLLLYGIAAAMLTLGVIRSLVNMAYKKAVADGQAGVAESQIWERRYAVGAIGSASCLGLWTFISMGVLESEFAGYASTAISMANLIGICGRNFPIARLFNWQLAAVGSGIVLGGVAWGGIHTVLALFMIPFIWGVRNIATSQRENLFSALTARMKADKLATQFDTALNNIPQAIVMLDSAR